MEAANQFQISHHSIVNAMQLTNFSFLNSSLEYLQSDNSRQVASARLSSGEKVNSGSRDLGAIGTEANFRSTKFQLQSNRVNTQNFLTFLDSQYQSMEQARSIYHQMETLAMRALDPALAESSSSGSHNSYGGSDLGLMKREFSELADELDSILARKINGQRMFGGRNVNFTEALQDRSGRDATPIVTTQDVYATSGEITVKLAPGSQADQIWIFQGELSDEAKNLLKQQAATWTPATGWVENSDIFDKLEEEFTNKGIFRTGTWQTSGGSGSVDSSGNYKYDTFKISFNSCEAKVEEFIPHPDNTVSLGQSLYNSNLLSGDLLVKPAPGNSTQLTMVGINKGNSATYEVEAEFRPSLPFNDIAIPWTGETFSAISFGNLGCSDISTKENARKVLDSIAAEFENLSSAMGQVAATMSRHKGELENMNNQYVANDYAMSRVIDTDIAQEATNLATASLKTQMSAQVMSKSTRLKDILIPLTTEHHRGSVLSSTL